MSLRAEIIAVGSELLTPSRIDTNSLLITARLNEIGIEVRAKAIVGDEPGDLAALFEQALSRADLIVLTGGLGPTGDDVTRDVVSRALNMPLEEHPDVLDGVRRRFESRGLRMPEINRRQAMVPRGARVLDNPHGTAPGLWMEARGRIIVLLPGPPREMRPMLAALVEGDLLARAGPERLYRAVLRVAGRTESHVEELAQPVYSRWLHEEMPIRTTILAAPGQIELHLSVQAADPDEGRARLDRATAELAAVLGRDLVSTDGRAIEEVVGDLLRERRLRIAVAESCTGGLVTSRLTDVPGSSDYVERGFICYSNRAKTELVDVPESLLREHGAVSEPVAAAMARGARDRAGVEVGVGVTGIAGPGGATATKPVGTVYIAVAWKDERVRSLLFPGGREQVKFQASQAALDMVRRMLLR